VFPPATQKDRFTKIWSREFYNFLVKEIRQDLDLVKAPKSFTYDPVKALANTGSYASFTPVSIVTAEQVRGGYKAPIVKVGALSSGPWGVVQSKCTQRQVADIVVAGVTWCNVTINNTAHKYAGIFGSALESQATKNNSVAQIIVPIENGPSLIQILPTEEVGCEGIQPGVYQGMVIAPTILPTETGPIAINNCLTTVVNARNYSNHCTFNNQDRVVLFVDNCCNMFFLGCGEGSVPVDCCDKSIFVCIEGWTQGVNGAFGRGVWVADNVQWGVPGCNPFTLEITTTCVSDTITANLTFSWGNLSTQVYTTTLDWSGLCDTPADTYEDTITVPGLGCDVTIVASLNMQDCIEDSPPGSCCNKELWFCLNNESVQLPVDGGSHTWDVSDCVNCEGAELSIYLTCNNGVILLNWNFTCNTTVEFNTLSISQFCGNAQPLSLPIHTLDGFMVLVIATTEQTCFECEAPVTDPCADPDDCVVVDCCGVAVPKTLTLTITGGGFAGTYTIVWDAGLSEWVITGSPGFSARLTCEALPEFVLIFEMDNYGEASLTCSPFVLTIDMTGNSYGITSLVITV